MGQDKDASVRYAAAQSLSVIGPDVTAALPHLIAALNDGGGEVLKKVIFTLGEMGSSATTVRLLPGKPLLRSPECSLAKRIVQETRAITPK
jgi:hypothetical protein